MFFGAERAESKRIGHTETLERKALLHGDEDYSAGEASCRSP